jgi:UDP-GlcNAc:undecaprenyl-phosphate/decaprenyl-phosphate GlcNAc-1-phosphate transferase
MAMIIFFFFISLLISLFITPYIGKLGIRQGALDHPDERKVHHQPIPRVGGLAIFISFSIALSIGFILNSDVFQIFISNKKIIYFYLGALICFGVGLVDDFKHVDFKIKFLFQILGGTIAYVGGVQIENILYFKLNIYHPLLSYGITIFWFLLLINAVNLIDGLDGLAGGITLIVSLFTGLFAIWRGQHATALMFFILSGATMGFLRYNFNPATIFMGDGGSYFIGYMVAGISILGTSKGETGAVLLILLVAMGIPVFDTILAPVRRFLQGRNIFQPDKGHIHHRLIARGLSTRKAVLTLYGISIGLSIVSIILVNLNDRVIGAFLLIMGIGAMILTKKLGYFEYFAWDKIYGWIKDITDEAGLNRERRTFLSLQMEIAASETLEEMWLNICLALEKLKFNRAEFHIGSRYGKNNGKGNGNGDGNGPESAKQSKREIMGNEINLPGPNAANFSMIMEKEISMPWIWSRGQYQSGADPFPDRLLKIDLPLVNGGELSFGALRLIKDLKEEPIDYYTLRRVESLRRAAVKTMDKILKAEGGKNRNGGQVSSLGNHS